MPEDHMFYNIQSTLLDHPGKVALIVYTRACNWKCFGCYNMRNLLKDDFVKPISTQSICKKLNSPLVDMLIVSGGEALLLGDTLLEELLFIKQQTNKPIRVDTNGTRPEYVKKAKDVKAVDGFAMDVKYPYWRGKNFVLAKTITGVEVDTNAVLESMSYVDGMNYSLFRTVAYPFLDQEILKSMEVYMRRNYVSPYYINPFYHMTKEV